MAINETIRSERRERAKRVLKSFGALVTLNDSTLKLAQDIESRLFSVTAQMAETRGSGAAKDAMADNIAAYEELGEKLRNQSSMLGDRLDELNELMMRVIEVDELAGSVLTLRYYSVGKPMEFIEIADRIGPYSEAHIKTKHGDGLDIVAGLLGF